MKKAIFFALVFTSILLGNRADAEKLVIAWTAVSAFNSPFWVMNDAGF